jgi:hypothetical protein
MKYRTLIALSLFTTLVAACGGDDSSTTGTTAGAGEGGAGEGGAGGDGGAGEGGAGGGGAGDECNAVVRIGLFMTDACDGDPALIVTMPIDQPCVGWSHGNPSREDSATRFQCYRDRLCYTQYVGNQTCDAPSASIVTDKESRTTCMKDPTPNIYTRILSGTEGCPEPPAGFECPLSGPGGGTQGLEAACPGG